MKKLCAAAIAFGLLASFGLTAPAADVEEGFATLFNGQDLTGWVKRGGSAQYRVEDGSIIGKCVPDTPGNTFLCSEKEFGNFILRLQYKFLEAGNSGVQFRSAARPEGDHERVYGYQYEITPDGGSTGRIYDEGRRGHKFGIIWLDAYTPQDRLATAEAGCKVGEWNDVEIQCVGPSIKTWLNGNLVVDMFDSFSMKGFFGLQIHAGKSGSVAWKNIRVKDLGESKWEPFFVKGDDGKYQLVDAKFVLPEEWSFTEDGVLCGVHSKTQEKDGLVISTKNYDDFIARVTYRMHGGNSAMYFAPKKRPPRGYCVDSKTKLPTTARTPHLSIHPDTSKKATARPSASFSLVLSLILELCDVNILEFHVFRAEDQLLHGQTRDDRKASCVVPRFPRQSGNRRSCRRP